MGETTTKVCFKCGRSLDLSMFYRHSLMADGHLNKCKDCTRKDVHGNYMEKIQDPLFIEGERARGREKYNRLYKGVPKKYRLRSGGTRRYFENRGYSFSEDEELHHWNYNEKFCVFVLTRQHHARLHKLLERGPTETLFRFKGELLDTIEKHERVVKLAMDSSYRILFPSEL